MAEKSPLENVRASTDAAARALSHMATELRKAGYVDAFPTYERMVGTLLQQQAWLRGQGPQERVAEWSRVQEAARDVVDLLYPYVRLLSRLAATFPAEKREIHERGDREKVAELAEAPGQFPDSGTPAPSPPSAQNDLRSAIHSILSSAAPLSATQIAARLSVPSRQILKTLDEMVALGRAQRTGASRPLYRVKRREERG